MVVVETVLESLRPCLAAWKKLDSRERSEYRDEAEGEAIFWLLSVKRRINSMNC